jgi:D-beta-D-heptose 7-phosphate kinase / D-beta-D-heptose 1-phosphate adenosyltransferase
MAILNPELAAKIARWKSAGREIVFTNGVFDLLHPGHVAILQEARKLGDRLVVGLNSDASVKLLHKGDDRPLLDQRARQAMLGALRCVDGVALFDEPTPLELIALIQPDVLVKGEDYSGREVVGRETVEAGGGRVVLLPLLEGYSTTAILARIRGAK